MTANIIDIKNSFFLATDQITDTQLPYIGGKARQLYELHQLGLNVPQWVVIPTLVLNRFFTQPFDKARQQLLLRLEDVFSKDSRFAVRSSASQEDGIHHSFAGQFETELNVSFSELPQALQKVYDSASSDIVKNYCQKNKIIEQPKMAIIIQEMLEPTVAGVAFGMNPSNGNRHESVISAVYGLGEGLVSGELNADTFVIGETITSTIAKKEKARRSTATDGTQLVDIPEPLQEVATLNEQQIREVKDVSDILKQQFGKAQDIEFAYADDTLFLLQTRPVTGLQNIADQSGEYILWDNSNIVESYPGVSSPLTFSFILKVYEAAYKQISHLFGVPQKQIEANKDTYQNLLGLIKGRVYYNLVNWYCMLSQLPGFRLNAKFMENMMGVKESFDLPETNKMGKMEAWYRVITSVIKMVWQLIRLPKNSRDFHALLDTTIGHYKQIDFDKCRSEELMQHYITFEKVLLKKWKAPLVNDLFAMIFFGLLQKLCTKYFPNHPNLQNELVGGSGDIISTKPAKILLSIATDIQKDELAKDCFKTNTTSEILNHLEIGNFKSIYNQIQDFIEVFGDRCTGELKLETITYRQNPEALIHILKSYVLQGIKEKERNANNFRSEAEDIIVKELRGNWFRKRLFNYVLNQARKLVSGRENLRFERTRAFGMVRAMFSAIGKNWFSEGLLEAPRDIFYLTQQEIFDFIKGTSVNSEPKALVVLRKITYAEFEKSETPSERIATYGIVYHANDFYLQAETEDLDGDISGIGCCPGRVKGKVQVIHHPSEIDSLEGDILVTTSTDPGWVALFPTASAILVERGSLLSHSAIVAREMGIPCIVGIDQLLKKVKTGDIVEMDGSSGQLSIMQ